MKTKELIEAFGKECVLEVMVDKINEEQEHLAVLRKSYQQKMAYIATRNFPEAWHKIHYEGYVDRHTGVAIAQSEKILEKYSKIYLICKDKLPKSGIQDFQIEAARSSPVDALVTGNKRRVGGRIQCSCPFHEEKSPSFVIYPDNSWHCFGCAAHGKNAIDFLMKKDGLTFREAVASL